MIEGDSRKCVELRQTYANNSKVIVLYAMVGFEGGNTLGKILSSTPIPVDFDLLSIDIDGNDYHVLNAIRCVRPRVLVIEYNAKFPPPMDLVMPYDPHHTWDHTDFVGASLQAIASLAGRRGYRLVGTNLTGINAFFVRADLAADRFAEADTAALYNPARYWMRFMAGHPPGERFGYVSDAALEQALRNK